MELYQKMPLELYRALINHGPVALICTASGAGSYDLAPVAWCCPVQFNPANLLIVLGKRHQTYENIQKTKYFTLCVPNASQVEMVRQTGSISGRECDKYKEFNIQNFKAPTLDVLIPHGCVGFAECRVNESVSRELVDVIIGDVISGYVHKDAFDGERLLVEKDEGRTLHHLGSRVFAVPDPGNILR